MLIESTLTKRGGHPPQFAKTARSQRSSGIPGEIRSRKADALFASDSCRYHIRFFATSPRRDAALASMNIAADFQNSKRNVPSCFASTGNRQVNAMIQRVQRDGPDGSHSSSMRIAQFSSRAGHAAPP